jgi:hypothetical protein
VTGAADRGGRAAAWSWAALAGIALYVAIDAALVWLRPELSVLHNAESDYGSKGRYDWLMDVNFLLRCAIGLAVVRALALLRPADQRLRTGLVLLTVWSAASGLLAFFPDDPVGTETTGAARVHLLLAAVAFVAVVLGTVRSTRALRADPAWRPVALPLAVLAWGALVPIVLLGHARLRPHSLGGLYEKVFLGVELLWFLVVAAWVVMRSAELAPRAAGAATRSATPHRDPS